MPGRLCQLNDSEWLSNRSINFGSNFGGLLVRFKASYPSCYGWLFNGIHGPFIFCRY